MDVTALDGLPAALRLLRTRKGLLQSELAELSGVARSKISEWESNWGRFRISSLDEKPKELNDMGDTLQHG